MSTLEGPDSGPDVGVAVLFVVDGKILLGKRDKSPQAGCWQAPGGYMTPGETEFEAAGRICMNRLGFEPQGFTHGPFTNNIFRDENIHTVTLYLFADTTDISEAYFDGSDWSWFALDALPEPLFLPLEELIALYGRDYLISRGNP